MFPSEPKGSSLNKLTHPRMGRVPQHNNQVTTPPTEMSPLEWPSGCCVVGSLVHCLGEVYLICEVWHQVSSQISYKLSVYLLVFSLSFYLWLHKHLTFLSGKPLGILQGKQFSLLYMSSCKHTSYASFVPLPQLYNSTHSYSRGFLESIFYWCSSLNHIILIDVLPF